MGCTPDPWKPETEGSHNGSIRDIHGRVRDRALPGQGTHHSRKLPVYRNSNVWLKPSKNPYATVAKYTDDPHIDGFITDRILNNFLKPSASLIVSKVAGGRVVLFADNPNFRSSFYGTNRLLLNAIFLGNHIYVPG